MRLLEKLNPAFAVRSLFLLNVAGLDNASHGLPRHPVPTPPAAPHPRFRSLWNPDTCHVWLLARRTAH